MEFKLNYRRARNPAKRALGPSFESDAGAVSLKFEWMIAANVLVLKRPRLRWKMACSKVN